MIIIYYCYYYWRDYCESYCIAIFIIWRMKDESNEKYTYYDSAMIWYDTWRMKTQENILLHDCPECT